MAIKLDPIRQESKQGLQDTRSRFATWGRKLLTGTIITSLLVASIPSILTAAGKSKKSKETTVAQLAKNDKNNRNKKRAISVEMDNVVCENGVFRVKFEAKEGQSYLDLYVKGRYLGYDRSFDFSEFVSKNFHGKFTVTDIVMGNPSMMLKGIDGKGNYSYLLYSRICDKTRVTPITSGFNAEILQKLGVKVELKFDEETRTWRISYVRDETVLSCGTFSEDGKLLDDTESERYKEFEKEYLKAVELAKK